MHLLRDITMRLVFQKKKSCLLYIVTTTSCGSQYDSECRRSLFHLYLVLFLRFCWCSAETHVVINAVLVREKKITRKREGRQKMTCAGWALTLVLLIKRTRLIVFVLVLCTSFSVQLPFFHCMNHNMKACQLAQFSVLIWLPVSSINRISKLCLFFTLCSYGDHLWNFYCVTARGSSLARMHAMHRGAWSKGNLRILEAVMSVTKHRLLDCASRKVISIADSLGWEPVTEGG